MSKSKIATIAITVVAVTVFFAWLRSNITRVPGLSHIDPTVLTGMIMLLGIVGSAVLTWVLVQKNAPDKATSAAAAEAEAEEPTDVDSLLQDAGARLAESDIEKGAKLNTLPAVF